MQGVDVSLVAFMKPQLYRLNSTYSILSLSLYPSLPYIGGSWWTWHEWYRWCRRRKGNERWKWSNRNSRKNCEQKSLSKMSILVYVIIIVFYCRGLLVQWALRVWKEIWDLLDGVDLLENRHALLHTHILALRQYRCCLWYVCIISVLWFVQGLEGEPGEKGDEGEKGEVGPKVSYSSM